MFCTPFSHDIPRGESTFLVLSMKHNNIVTNDSLYNFMSYIGLVID